MLNNFIVLPQTEQGKQQPAVSDDDNILTLTQPVGSGAVRAGIHSVTS